MEVKKLDFGKWLIKTILAGALLGLLFDYASKNSVTIEQTIKALASIPLAFVVLIEIFDKIADKNDYYNALMKQFGKQGRASGILISIIFAGLGLFVVLWALTGTITMNLGSYGKHLCRRVNFALHFRSRDRR